MANKKNENSSSVKLLRDNSCKKNSALDAFLSYNRTERSGLPSTTYSSDEIRDTLLHILVATNVASRGSDVVDIHHVINYDIPDTADAYTHRVGRTGCAHKSGMAFTLAQPEDEAMVRQIEKVIGERLERQRLAEFNYGGFNPETRCKIKGNGNNGHRRSNGNGNSGRKGVNGNGRKSNHPNYQRNGAKRHGARSVVSVKLYSTMAHRAG